MSTFSHQYHLLSSGLRFFTVYGPWGRMDMFPFILLDRIVRGQTVQQFGDGSSSRDFTFVDDIVDGIVAVHDRRHVETDRSRQHELFNLGNCSPIALRDYIQLTELVVGRKAKVEMVEAQMGDVQHTFADCSKATRMVGYQPKVSIEEGMQRTYRWSLSPCPSLDAPRTWQPHLPFVAHRALFLGGVWLLAGTWTSTSRGGGAIHCLCPTRPPSLLLPLLRRLPHT